MFEGIDGRLQLIRRGLYRLEVRVVLAALRHRGDGLCESGRRRLDRGELGRQLRLDVSASGGGRRRHALDRGLEVTGSRTDLSSPGGLLDRRRSSRACGRGRRRRGSCCARSPRARGQQNCQGKQSESLLHRSFPRLTSVGVVTPLCRGYAGAPQARVANAGPRRSSGNRATVAVGTEPARYPLSDWEPCGGTGRDECPCRADAA